MLGTIQRASLFFQREKSVAKMFSNVERGCKKRQKIAEI
jgi:hypothetical protein